MSRGERRSFFFLHFLSTRAHPTPNPTLVPTVPPPSSSRCHPLGFFEGLPALAVATSMRELHRLVLVDTPLAPYFAEELTAGEEWGGGGGED